MEPIPEIILNHIEQETFDTLDESTQQLVLQYMSRAEYDSMHLTARLLHANKPDFPESSGKQKDQLMNRYIHHKSPALWQTPVQLWKAASIMLLLGAGWLLHWQAYQQRKVEYVTQLDTVYLEKEVPFKVYDTVYYKEESPVSYTSNTTKRNIPQQGTVKKHRHPVDAQAEPQRRGVSAKDDSLIQSFRFVTL